MWVPGWVVCVCVCVGVCVCMCVVALGGVCGGVDADTNRVYSTNSEQHLNYKAFND